MLLKTLRVLSIAPLLLEVLSQLGGKNRSMRDYTDPSGIYGR